MNALKFILLSTFAFSAACGFAAETEPVEKSGLTLRVVSDQNAVVPGEKITIGFFLQHDPTFHTYWKSPGVVGVPTTMKWELPKGFSAGEIQWPAPQRTKMATLTAWGYETDTCLLTEISVPETVSGETVTLKFQAGWMCCAAACHPDWSDFEITLPVSKAGAAPDRDKKWADVFEKTRDRFPKEKPADWKFSARKLNSKRESPIEATFALPTSIELPADFNLSELYFFCDDNQINSDAEQVIEIDPDRPHMVKMRFSGTDFGPEDAKSFSGVLFHAKGWPGLDSCWIEVSTSWPQEDEQEKQK